MKKLVSLSLSFCFVSLLFAFVAKPKQAYYQLTVYHLKNEAQIKKVDQYLKEAYLPALHRAGVEKVGVFKPLANDTAADKRIYVYIPMKSLNQLVTIDDAIWNDAQHQQTGAAYLDVTYDSACFLRKETIVLKAFPQMPNYEVPNLTGTAAEKIYELRSYEGASEKLYARKVDMFNAGGEVALFKRLSFNAVFYSSVIAGSHMPNLMYMTSFNSQADRDAHWKTFSSDPEWKRISALPQYLHTVSKSDILLMHATDYSEL